MNKIITIGREFGADCKTHFFYGKVHTRDGKAITS